MARNQPKKAEEKPKVKETPQKPQPAETKEKKQSVAKSYYRVAHDSAILKVINGSASTGVSKCEVAKQLAKQLNKPVQSVTERIKKYLGHLSS